MATEVECIACTIIGGGVFAGTGAYALWSSRPKAVGSRFGKGVVGLLGAVFLSMGVARLAPLRNLRQVSYDPAKNSPQGQ